MIHKDAHRTIENMDKLFNRLFIDEWAIEKEEVKQ